MIGYNQKNSIKKKAIILLAAYLVASTPIYAKEETQSAYTLIQVAEPTQTSFTVYENNDINKPQYYEVKLNNTTYGTGESSKYYKWETNSSGHTTLVETVESDAQVIVNYDSSNQQIRLSNSADISSSPLIGNYIQQRTSNYGGAIFNNRTIGDITGDFIGNYASGSGNAYGGAIFNNATIGNITGDFIGNVVSCFRWANGGAIYNNGTIGDITGDFIGNIVSNFGSNYAVHGGAISNYGTIGNITGNFIGNVVSDSGSNYIRGGAIHNEYGTIGNITGDFIGNYASTGSGPEARGGAISNWGSIGDITGNFIGNYASASGSNSVYGGAIYNDNNGTIGDITGNFIGNYAYGSGYGSNSVYGGAICNYGTIGDITGDFIGNYASGDYVYGGAIFNSEYGTIGQKDSEGNVIGGIINSRFLNNRATSKEGTAQGGAIHSYNDLNIIADNGVSEFSGNYTQVGDVRDDNAIYMNNKDTKLSLIARNKGNIILNDNIDGNSEGYNISVLGDNTGTLHLFNDFRNANVDMGGINLNTINNLTYDYSFNSFTLSDDINFYADVDLANESMDRISANIYGEHAGNINVKGMNLLSDANQEITSILFADNGLKDNVIYAGDELPHEGYQTSFYTPIYKYNAVYDNKDDGGYFVFTKGDKIYVPTPGGTAGGGIISSGNSSDAFNPAVLGDSTSSIVGAVGTINQTVNNSFHSVDTFMNLPSFDRLAIKNQNKYAFNMGDDTMNLGKFSPLYQAQDEDHGIWVRPYATFESVPLKNGPKVSNIAYGTLVGFDTGLKELKNGWDRVWTGYLGYNGASQHFSGVDSTQNGGLLGGTLSLYRGNFFNATTLTVGANVAENQTMYGRDNLTMLMSGIANKCGYNIEFKDGKFILQPSVVLGYSFINTFDYTNAAGVKIDNKPTNYIQIAPGVKFIGNLKNGWQPYAGVNMVWNLMGETNSTANGIKLPEMSIKPYVQYGVGVQKRIKDKFTAYTQAMVHNGGRNGVALTFGFKWTLGGNDKKKSEKELKISDNKNIKRFEIKAKKDK